MYGYSQTQPLPCNDFNFVDVKSTLFKEMEEELLKSKIPEFQNDTQNFFCEVDLEITENAQKNTKDFPFAPTTRTVHYHEMSHMQKFDYRKNLKTKDVPKTLPNKKLIADFVKKEKYVIHADHLRLLLKNGVKITKVHRILIFKQKPFLKDWVDFCTEQRNMATTEAESSFWKLLVNSTYGKLIENIENYSSMKIVIGAPSDLLKASSHFRWKSSIIINENTSIQMYHPHTYSYNKPIGSGFAVLEYSKLKMAEHWICIKEKWGERCSLLYTDTDSFVIGVYTNDISADLKNINEICDFSDQKNTDHFSEMNAGVLGVLKIDTGQKIPEVFTCLYRYDFSISDYHSALTNLVYFHSVKVGLIDASHSFRMTPPTTSKNESNRKPTVTP